MDLYGKVWCYYLDQAMVNEDGKFRPCIVVENESGYYPTNWSWGRNWDIAKKCLDDMNKKIGVSEIEMHRIVDTSMRESMIKTRVLKAKRKTLPTMIGQAQSAEVQGLLEKRLKAA